MQQVEEYFFKYAFPCAEVLLEWGSITPGEYEELEKIFFAKKVPDKKTLEKVFIAAFRRIKKLAQGMGKDYWDSEVIREYWEKNHNEIIDKGEGNYSKVPESFKDLCRVHVAEITYRKEGKMVVKYKDKKRVVFDFLVPDAKIGEKVRIHFSYAICKAE
jgi:hypothetical protein